MFSWRAATLLLLATWLHMAFYWTRLPERVAVHFGVGGEPDGWSARTTFAILMLSIAGGQFVLFWLISRFLGRLPDALINVPYRDYWLAPERRQRCFELVGDWLGILVAGTMAFMLALQHVVVEANLGDGTLGPGFGWSMGAYLTFVGVWLWRLFVALRPPVQSAA